MLIQKLLRFQTIPGPYLGNTSGLIHGPVKISPFVLPVSQPKPSLPVLQSQSQHIQIQFQKTVTGAPPAPPHPMTPESSQLCKTTLQQLRQHPVQPSEKALRQLTTPAAIETAFVEPSQAEVPQQVLLSFLALERPFEKEKKARAKKGLQGTPYIDFVFPWEETSEQETESGPCEKKG